MNKDIHRFRHWFAGSKAVQMVGGSSSKDAVFAPQVMYHTTRQGGFDRFELGRPTVNSTSFGDVATVRHAIFVTPSVSDSNAYGVQDGQFVSGAATMPLYVRACTPLDLTDGPSEAEEQRLLAAGFSARFVYNHLHDWAIFDGDEGAEIVAMLQKAGFDAVIFNDENPLTGDAYEAWAVFCPEQLISAIGQPSIMFPAQPVRHQMNAEEEGLSP